MAEFLAWTCGQAITEFGFDAREVTPHDVYFSFGFVPNFFKIEFYHYI